MKLVLACGLLLGGLGGVAAAVEDGATAGFALDRFVAAEAGSDWFVLESLDLRGHLRWAAGLGVDWASKPLVIYNEDGSQRAALVEQQLTSRLGASLNLWSRLRVAASLPVLIEESGDSGTLRGMTYIAPTGAALGDLRLGADARVAGAYGGPATLAAGAQLELPTGNRASFAGDGAVRLALRLLAAGQAGRLAWAGKAGFLYRGQETPIDGTPFGSEAFLGGAVGVRALGGRLLAGAEAYGSSTVSDGFLERRTTAFELLVGAHVRIARTWRVGVGVGPGLARAAGTPALRLVGSIDWTPPPAAAPLPPSDRDGDGIVDHEDACPDVPGVRSADPRRNGCPPPVAPPPPPPDRDGDGVVDEVDACADTPGVPTDDPRTNGCPAPPPDTDGDGIADPDDACPTSPGPRDADPARNGCPLAHVSTGKIRLLQQIQFDFASDRITPDSEPTLRAVVDTLLQHPEITHVTVEGHTDNVGTRQYNQRLSERRAQAVVRWLVGHGVAAVRLGAQGFGFDRPIDSNDTEQGRQNNRRVELRIDEEVTP